MTTCVNLTISVILIIQNVIFESLRTNRFSYSSTSIYSFLFLTFLLVSIWFFVKPILENKIKFENELKKFKRNFNFFQFLSKNIEEYDGFEELKGITYGKKNATAQITLILSPNCSASHKAFKEAYELFKSFSEKVSLNVLFNINPNNSNNTYKMIVENLLALNEQNPEKAKEAIIDWHIHQLNLKTWKRKWTVEAPIFLINKELKNQYYWCLKNEFNNTPVRIINENLFPNEYEISELKYFINDFEEEFEYEESLKVV